MGRNQTETEERESRNLVVFSLGNSSLPSLVLWPFSSPGGAWVPPEAACQQGHTGLCPASHRVSKGVGIGGLFSEVFTWLPRRLRGKSGSVLSSLVEICGGGEVL